MTKKHNYNLIVGICITAILVLTVVIGAVWTPYAPNATNSQEKLSSPSVSHLLGTDNFGRDILSRVIDGMGATLIIAAATVVIGATVGILIGAFTGYYGGRIDGVIMRINDALAAFPSILLALVLISLMGSGKYNIIIALGILFIPSFARVVRGEFVRCRNMDYVRSAKLMGASNLRIMFLHILPNTMPVILSTVAIGFNNAVLAEASMSYLGLGVQPPDPSLGYMLSEAQSYLFSAPWYAISVGCAIVLLIFGFNELGEGIGGRNDVGY